MENNDDKQLDAVRIIAHTPLGAVESAWSKDEDQAVQMGGLIKNISNLAVMQFPDEDGVDTFLPEQVIQNSVFKLEIRWK